LFFKLSVPRNNWGRKEKEKEKFLKKGGSMQKEVLANGKLEIRRKNQPGGNQ